jgi:nicotinamide-nucleotide amidase
VKAVPLKALRRAAILAVGSELLTPSKLDTNSLYLTERLNLLGIDLAFKSVIGDDREELARAVQAALERVDLLVCTGGLGPTDDDVTREVVAGVLGRPLRENASIADRIRARFEGRGLQMPEINRRQAMVPEGAQILENTKGTAPGLWLEQGDRVIVLLPGPPREMKPMVSVLMDGLLKTRASGDALVRRVIKITGRSESHTEEAVRPLYAQWASERVPVTATILASLGQIELHLSARGASVADAATAVDTAVGEVSARLGPDAYSIEGHPLEQVVGELLRARGYRIALAESCTGGLIASRLTDVAGSSDYVTRGVVAYANDAKTDLLGVPAALIAEHGAVSEPVAVAMARGIRASAGTEVALGVTGIAGPGGGTPEKPVGTVAVAAIVGDTLRTRIYRFVGDRELIKFQASQAALDMVRRILQA